MTLSLYVRHEADTNGSFGGIHQWTAGPLECIRVQKTQRGVNNPGMQNYTRPPSHPLSQPLCTRHPCHHTSFPAAFLPSFFSASTQYFFASPLLQQINIFGVGMTELEADTQQAAPFSRREWGRVGRGDSVTD